MRLKSWLKIFGATIIFYTYTIGFATNFTFAISIAILISNGTETTLSVAYLYRFVIVTLILSAPFTLFAFTTVGDFSITRTLKHSGVLRKLNLFYVFFYLLPKGVLWYVKKYLLVKQHQNSR